MATDNNGGPDGPPFFIVGSARSGTTLVRLMLNAHPEVAVPPESRFITELWRGRYEVDVDELLSALAAHPRFALWELPIDAVRQQLGAGGEDGRAPYAAVMGAAFAAWAKVNGGKVRWGDKTPRYVEHMPLLARLWPEAHFVHLVRDGRNVAMSYADVTFGPRTVARAAELWAARVTAGRGHGRFLGGRYHELRYEDFVADPDDCAKELCGWLDLPFDRAMLDYAEGGRGGVLPRAGRNNPHVGGPLRTNTRTWEREMKERHVEVFEAIAGDVLAELGYPRRHHHISSLARLEARLGRLGLPVTRLERSARHS
ncbi:MAG: sulfotransferase [Actinobacteria bacterium]|nr:sulfotransferase [Actinomycetota bacterium]